MGGTSLTGKRLQLKLAVRRLFCDNPDCKKRTFAERFPTFLKPFARRTQRLALQQRQNGLALGGAAGARELKTLAMPLSGDTLLRLVRAIPHEAAPAPRVIGIDDWAWCRGQRYGTILIDLERQQVIDLLPDRAPESVSAWLQAHPEIEIISRDRGTEYIQGITQGAPTAIQVADRWHLLHNLKETLERLLERNPACLTAAGAEALPLPAPEALCPVELPSPPSTEMSPAPIQLTRAEERRQLTRNKRLTRYQTVVELNEQGWSDRAIAQHLGMGKHTVAHWLNLGIFPEMAQRKKKPSLLDPYVPYLLQRWQEGCHKSSLLYQEILSRGYPGCESTLRAWVTQRRKQEPAPPAPLPGKAPILPKPDLPRPWASRQAVWLLLEEAQLLDPDRKAALDRMLDASAIVRQAYHFGQAFRRIIRERFSKALEPWIKAVKTYEIPELVTFARSLSRDRAAVTAALTLPWSNGQTEGQVNRLKMIKRQMYGRAGFELLRARVLGGATV